MLWNVGAEQAENLKNVGIHIEMHKHFLFLCKMGHSEEFYHRQDVGFMAFNRQKKKKKEKKRLSNNTEENLNI